MFNRCALFGICCRFFSERCYYETDMEWLPAWWKRHADLGESFCYLLEEAADMACQLDGLDDALSGVDCVLLNVRKLKDDPTRLPSLARYLRRVLDIDQEWLMDAMRVVEVDVCSMRERVGRLVAIRGQLVAYIVGEMESLAERVLKLLEWYAEIEDGYAAFYREHGVEL